MGRRSSITLTPRQLEMAYFIYEYRKEMKVSPTLQEMADEFGVTKITIHEQIRFMVQREAVTVEKYQTRSIKLTDGCVNLITENKTCPHCGGSLKGI